MEVGIDDYVEKINLWLQDNQSNDVKILSIYGIGGIGKTTIAKIVYNQSYDKFEGSCFLSDFREKSEQKDVPSLQKELLSKILKRKPSEKIYSVDEGVIKIQEAICCRKVLNVLDDLGDLKQFEQIIGQQEWLSPGSKIITTRSKSLFNGHECFRPLEIKPLGHHHSLQLFSLHAFGRDNPPEDLDEQSNRVVSYCDGLPLALGVLGSSLFGSRSIDLWESAVQEMQAIPNGFFIGIDRDVVVKILDGCGFYTIIGIEHLINRCLIAINEHNELMMHQLVRHMGREIVRKESHDEPGKRSRVWDDAEAFRVSTEKTGTKTIRGLTLDLHKLKEEYESMDTISIHGKPRFDSSVGKSKRRRIGDIYSQLKNYIQTTSPTSSNLIKTEPFAKMPKLNLLKLNNVTLEGGYKDFPKDLLWLCWHGFSWKFIPTNSCLKKFFVLEMQNTSLHVWHRKLSFPCLKILNLNHSHFLATMLEFYSVPSLERLILEDCIDLVKIDKSIVALDRLILLNLKDCVKLGKLPTTIGSLESLQTLILTDCSERKELPKELVQINSLQVFIADGVALDELYYQFKCSQGNKIIGLNFCIVYELESELEPVPVSPLACIENTTRSLRWIYNPAFQAVVVNPETLGNILELSDDMLWLSHLEVF